MGNATKSAVAPKDKRHDLVFIAEYSDPPDTKRCAVALLLLLQYRTNERVQESGNDDRAKCVTQEH